MSLHNYMLNARQIRHAVTVPMPSFEELRTHADLDHYKRLALRAKLRQAGLLYPSFFEGIEGVGLRTWMRTGSTWRTSEDLLDIQRRHHRHNARVYARYERRVLPNPFILAVRDEMRALIVDLSQWQRHYPDDRRDVPLWEIAWPGAVWLIGVAVGIFIGWGWWG